MKADDDYMTATEAAQLRAEIASARKWMKQWDADRRKMLELERQLAVVAQVVADLKSDPAKLAKVAWVKAADAAVLSGGISLNQLANRRKAGVIPRHGWRQINARVFEYRTDVILSVMLA